MRGCVGAMKGLLGFQPPLCPWVASSGLVHQPCKHLAVALAGCQSPLLTRRVKLEVGDLHIS